MKNPDFADLARAMGGKGLTATSEEHLEAVVKEFLFSDPDTPTLLNAVCEADEHVYPMLVCACNRYYYFDSGRWHSPYIPSCLSPCHSPFSAGFPLAMVSMKWFLAEKRKRRIARAVAAVDLNDIQQLIIRGGETRGRPPPFSFQRERGSPRQASAT